MSHHAISPASSPPCSPSLWDASIAGLHALFLAFVGAAQDMAAGSEALLKTVRSIRRVIKCISSAETARYQAVLTAKMLGDPAWRGRVYADLGGYFGMTEWRRQFAAAQAYQAPAQVSAAAPASTADAHWASHFDSAKENAEGNAKGNGAGRHDAVKTDQRGQFRLAPLPRPFLSFPRNRVDSPSSADGSREFKSPLSQPIPLHPNVFAAARRRAPNDAKTPHQYGARSHDRDDDKSEDAAERRFDKTAIKPP